MKQLQIIKLNTIKVIFVLCVSILIIECTTHIFRRMYDSFILDNVNHYLSCNKLPPLSKVETVVYSHKETIETIIREVGKRYRTGVITPVWCKCQMVSDGEDSYVTFSWNTPQQCQGTDKGEIVITYPSHKDRIIIEQIIGGKTFFGIPYRFVNN